MTSETGCAIEPYKSNALEKKTKKISRADEKYLSIICQLEWIKGLEKQVDFANDPEVLSDFTLELKIRRRRTKC
jgi:hypothetical protein